MSQLSGNLKLVEKNNQRNPYQETDPNVINFLVVDKNNDLEPVIKKLFRRKIREGDYIFHFVGGGIQGVNHLKQHKDIDIVLTDINIPVMKGKTFLLYLKEEYPTIKSVVISEHDDIPSLRQAMKRGAVDFITKPIDTYDLEATVDKTITYVLELKNTLKSIRENDILKKYVGLDVLNSMLKSRFTNTLMHNEKINGSVAFIDICGFTALSESHPAHKVIKLLNSYLDIIISEISLHDGRLDKFIGDAVMAVFTGPNHIDIAIETSLAIRKKMETMKAELEAGLVYTPKVSIGINAGEMISGNIGSETYQRLDYTVIGDVVNTASRLQNHALENQILITEDCYRNISDYFVCERLGERRLKNKLKPVVIYNVLE